MVREQAAYCSETGKRGTHVTSLTSASGLIEDTPAGRRRAERCLQYIRIYFR